MPRERLQTTPQSGDEDEDDDKKQKDDASFDYCEGK